MDIANTIFEHKNKETTGNIHCRSQLTNGVGQVYGTGTSTLEQGISKALYVQKIGRKEKYFKKVQCIWKFAKKGVC